MAIPGLSAIPRRVGVGTAATLLFERLPVQLFRPLASANRQQYWALLCALHARRFGPDAPLPPSHGFSTREIVQDIEEELQIQDVWEAEEGETPETPLGIRANGVFNRLLESGWFRIDRYGVGWNVTMRPAVSQFLSLLVSFAETGPVFVAGKVRSIDLNLQLVESGEGAGDTLAEAAEQTRNLLEHVRNTGTNIRDLMDSLGVEITTAQYVHRFFNDYIERVFIGDYRELRTREHPLSKRPQILRRVEEIHTSEAHRTRLIAWYESKRCPGDRSKAERLFEKDIQRLLELQRIDDYLDRLDDEIRRANKRALAFLDYRLRSLRPIDHMVEKAIQAVLSDSDNTIGAPFAPGEMISGARLAEPRKRIERTPPSSLRQHVPSEAEIARSHLMLRARDARSITPPKLAEFVRRQLDGQTLVKNDKLKLDRVADVRTYQVLTMARGFRVRMNGVDEVPCAPISGVPFLVELTKKTGQKQGHKWVNTGNRWHRARVRQTQRRNSRRLRIVS